jgi:SHS family lactate transporter-like MFS transporter
LPIPGDIAARFEAGADCSFGGGRAQHSVNRQRFPTEVRATAAAFCYHQAAIFGGFVPLVLTFVAERYGTGLAVPMIIGTWIGCLAWAAAAFYGPETKGKLLVPDLVVA